MKLDFLKKGLLLSAITLSMFFVSCSDSDKDNPTPSELTEAEAREVVSSALSVKDLFLFSSHLKGGFLASRGAKTSGCNLSKVIKIKNGKFRYNFDPSCVFFGKTYEGTLDIEYKPKENGGYTVTITFGNFKKNKIKFNGSITFDIMLKNDAGHLYVNTKFDLTITLENGKKTIGKGSLELEKVEGNETPMELSDDVYEVSGSWMLVGFDGVKKEVKIIKNLVIKSPIECRYPTSGTLEVKKGSETHIIDFGDGTCDNKFTLDGKEHSYR